MIDSHCHLDHEPLFSDLPNVLQRSKDVGIEKLLTISTSFESFTRVKELIDRDDMIYGTIGIHPHESSKNIITSKQIIENLNESSKIISSLLTNSLTLEKLLKDVDIVNNFLIPTSLDLCKTFGKSLNRGS